MKVLEIEQSTPAWAAFRQTHITATDLRKLLGVCPFRGTPLKVWEHKCLGYEEPFYSPAASRGLELEPAARAWLEAETGLSFAPAVVESSECAWAGASLDGLNVDNQILAEIKCGSQKLHDQALQNIVPDYYQSQIQWQLYVTGYQKALYVSFTGLGGHIVEVNRDENLIQEMLSTAKKFWHDHVLAYEPPPLSDSDWAEDNSSEWLEYAALKKQTSERLRQAKFEDDAVRAKIEQLAGDRKRVRGGGVAFSRVTRLGAVDYKKMLQTLNISVDENLFRKTSTSVVVIREE